MTEYQLQDYQRRLEGLVAHVAAILARLEAVVPAVATHLGDRWMESLLSTEGRVLEEAEGALGRIASGAFGRCEACKHPLPRVLLASMPYARHCTKCARRLAVAPGPPS